MKKLSIICAIIFVFAMITSSVLAQDCDDGNACTNDQYDIITEQCTHNPVNCDDSNLCTTDTCDTTIGCQNIPIDCEDGNPATNDTCDSTTGACINIPMVSVDIKPGSCQNPLNVRSRGVLPVAILGTEDFDVMTIDPETIILTREGFEGVPPIRYSYGDAGTPSDGEPCTCDDLDAVDVDEDDPVEDGYTDLKLKFSVPELVEGVGLAELGLEEVKPREIILLTIVGTTADGAPIMGQDCVQIINKLKWWSGPKGPNGPKEPKEPNGPKEPKETNGPKEPNGPKRPKESKAER